MTDIFQEVEEEVRRERFEQIWKKYGDYFIAGACLIIIGVAAFQLWRIYERRQEQTASETFALANQMLEAGDSTDSASTFAKLATTAPGGYARLALLQKANALNAGGNTAAAVKVYRDIIAGNDPLLAPVARIRAAWALVDGAPRGEVDALVQPLAQPQSPWHPMAREIFAYEDYREGALAKAAREYRAIAADKDSSSWVRRRSDAMATYLAAGGDANYGTVPQPPPPKPAAAPAQGAKPQ